MRPRIQEKYIDEVKQMVEAGYTTKAISSKLTIGTRTIDSIRENNNIKRLNKIHSRQCQYCFICFETYKINQQYCSIYCQALGKRRYPNGPPPEWKCYKCGQVKPINDFGLHNGKPTGRAYICKQCRPSAANNLLRRIRESGYRKNDLRFRLSNKMRSSIYLSLKSNGSKNGRHWEDLVGYTWKQLKIHLQKQFEPGMSWDNYGEWHIDHKIPIVAFNFGKPEDLDFKRCWALSNLQPMWAKENMLKCDNLEKPFSAMPSDCYK